MSPQENVQRLIHQLKTEQAAKYKNGIYHYTQTSLAYNSNRIEGSKLSHEHTINLFNTHTILSSGDEVIDSNDIIETMNHFRAFDYILKNYDQPTDENFIKQLHKILKANTTDADLDWFNVGEYKGLPNQNIRSHNFHDLLKFHVDFEAIHPFQDGNGRVGRLLLFKDCLAFGIVPFIIDNDHKQFYYRCLREFYREPGYLTDTCLSAQDKYTAYCKHFVKDFI